MPLSTPSVKPNQGGVRDREKSRTIGRILEFFLRWTGVLLGLAFLAAGAYLYDIQHIHKASPFLVFPEIFLAEIGSVLLAVSLLHLGYEHGLRDTQLDTSIEALRIVLDGRSGLNSLGMMAGWRSIPIPLLRELFEGASAIRVLKTYHPEEHSLEAGIQHALSQPNPATVEFFLCKIDSKLLEQRCTSADKQQTEGKTKTVRLVHEISKWTAHQTSSTASVTFYDCWPGPPLIDCDGRLFVGFYLWGMSSLDSPWVEVDLDTEFGQDLIKQFNRIREVATETLKVKQDFDVWLKANDPANHSAAA
jgi:hypothetical protein